jgi:hypothetical protein
VRDFEGEAKRALAQAGVIPPKPHEHSWQAGPVIAWEVFDGDSSYRSPGYRNATDMVLVCYCGQIQKENLR